MGDEAQVEMPKYQSHKQVCALKIASIFNDINEERQRQDAKFGGPDHDDQHDVADFARFIEDYAGWVRVQAGAGRIF